MARIEIPIEEYNAMKARINELENSVSSKDKELEELRNKNLDLQTIIEDIESLPLIERVINWKSNLKSILGEYSDE